MSPMRQAQIVTGVKVNGLAYPHVERERHDVCGWKGNEVVRDEDDRGGDCLAA